MKSKIVKQFGAMLLAGIMIVTSGNVTTYTEVAAYFQALESKQTECQN